MNLQFQDTIAALATPLGEGGVAIIRISGPLAPEILKKMFRASSPPAWESHHLYYGNLYNSAGFLLDQILAVWMKAPHSFTGEEIVEFHIHGGRWLAWQVLHSIYELGARAAHAGEFSQRAFLNGKIDLTQAEAIADMIAAQSDLALQLAQAQWAGALSRPVAELRKKLLEALVQLEAAIDFPEEDIEILQFSKMKDLLESILHPLKKWIADYDLGRIIREGPLVVLIGKPNVGKSSLLNALVHEEAAIVHHQPGTTRDSIEKRINLGGLSLRLIDTAGIRKAHESVEKEGIYRSKAWLEKADLVLLLLDPSLPLEEADFDLIKLVSAKKTFFLLNKSDLPFLWQIGEKLPHLASASYLKISAKTGQGLRELENKIPELFGVADFEKGSQVMINQLRHKQALQQAAFCLENAILSLNQKASPELISADLSHAANYIGEIIGEVSTEHILEDIFNRFCIGK